MNHEIINHNQYYCTWWLSSLDSLLMAKYTWFILGISIYHISLFFMTWRSINMSIVSYSVGWKRFLTVLLIDHRDRFLVISVRRDSFFEGREATRKSWDNGTFHSIATLVSSCSCYCRIWAKYFIANYIAFSLLYRCIHVYAKVQTDRRIRC